ncbi:TetR/AcrR family transcriptional regulator [Streptomyces sp. NPDC017979]|uniref:TetR/AcrR family transcriptional regulator n=1 Tax=Streptomyces sp. NPDC017979 TaxID=3365024 RepID=UPI0037889F83
MTDSSGAVHRPAAQRAERTTAPGAAPAGARPRRADARRSRAAVLDAAVRVLGERPEAGLGAVAAAAGVTRQTIYAHFASREGLLAAVVDHVTEQAVVAMDAVDLDAGPAADALLRLLDAAARSTGRHPELVRAINSLPASPEEDRDRHVPVVDRIARVVRRGQDAGEFTADLPTTWLTTVVIALAHTAHGEAGGGGMTAAEANAALHVTVLRALGADGNSPPASPSSSASRPNPA